MTLSMALFTFINAWWLMLFLVLPFRKGQPRWKKLFVVNTLLSILATLALALLLKSGIVPLDI